ncbi:hypothetical protein VST63_14130 [Mycolicibacterium sp. 050232]|uniref:hypothetical protein n=1 Tax=Mycolicibacterium sp. 050232 TaxID=3113982 RepID=UPI002E2D7054|nr:hypothetical protein [Mycolicibacterium sp. 050232]MED5813495.1 hypothetical protein [Mycolicibacterium sp. 050232]
MNLSVVALSDPRTTPWADAHTGHVARTAAALASAMGIGRFVYTPILPLKSTQVRLGAHCQVSALPG